MKNLSKLIRIVFFLIISQYSIINNQLKAQISQGGTPPSFILDENSSSFNVSKSFSKSLPIYEEKVLPKPDLQQIINEDKINDSIGLPPRVGVLLEAGFNMENSGTWTLLPDGKKIWRLKMSSDGAEALNLYFDDFYLPPKSKLFLYNHDKSHVIGAFTEINNKESGRFATELVYGDEITIEYVAPKMYKQKEHNFRQKM